MAGSPTQKRVRAHLSKCAQDPGGGGRNRRRCPEANNHALARTFCNARRIVLTCFVLVLDFMCVFLPRRSICPPFFASVVVWWPVDDELPKTCRLPVLIPLCGRIGYETARRPRPPPFWTRAAAAAAAPCPPMRSSTNKWNYRRSPQGTAEKTAYAAEAQASCAPRARAPAPG